MALRGILGPGKTVRYNIGDTGLVQHVPNALSNEGELSLLPGCPRLRDSVEGCQQQLVVGPQLELVALQSKPEVADGCEGSQCSLSKAEYLQSAAESFLKKNPHGRQPFTSFFCQGKLRMPIDRYFTLKTQIHQSK